MPEDLDGISSQDSGISGKTEYEPANSAENVVSYVVKESDYQRLQEWSKNAQDGDIQVAPIPVFSPEMKFLGTLSQ